MKNYGMELFEIIGWLTIGFVPTLASMEIAWKVAKRRMIERAPMTPPEYDLQSNNIE